MADLHMHTSVHIQREGSMEDRQTASIHTFIPLLIAKELGSDSRRTSIIMSVYVTQTVHEVE